MSTIGLTKKKQPSWLLRYFYHTSNDVYELDLRSTKKWTEKVKSLIEKHHGKIVPVPHNMTNYLQPLDLIMQVGTVNRSCKPFLRDKAQEWYAGQVQVQIARKGNRTRKCCRWLKDQPLNANRAVTQYYDHIRANKDNFGGEDVEFRIRLKRKWFLKCFFGVYFILNRPHNVSSRCYRSEKQFYIWIRKSFDCFLARV